MRIIDRINQALGRGADERQLNAITRIVIHHSGSPNNGNHLNTALFEAWWRTQPSMGAPDARGGYHEVVLFNGNVEINMQDRRMTWGAANQNGYTWHICAVGQHLGNVSNITQQQLDVLGTRIANKFRDLGWTANHVDRIVRHKDLPGQNTSCNNININLIRNQVRTLLSDAPLNDTPSTPPTDTRETFVVTQATGGFNTAADAAVNRNRRTTVQPGTYHVFNRAQGMVNVTHSRGVPGSWINPAGQGTSSNVTSTHTVRAGETLSGIAQLHRTTVAELQRLNNISNINLIRVGQVLRLPATSNNTTTTTTTTNAIRVGSRVRVNSNARTWATGQGIPSWVRGQTYTVQQLRNNNREALLSNVISWIRVTDVTVL